MVWSNMETSHAKRDDGERKLDTFTGLVLMLSVLYTMGSLVTVGSRDLAGSIP